VTRRYAWYRNTQVIVTSNRAPKWTAARRYQVAMANDNGGQWYVVRTTKTVADIERRFNEQSLATLLAEVMGGVLGDHKSLKTSPGHYLYFQLLDVTADVVLCLEEYLDAQIVQEIQLADVRYP
jgi:hypothetical protein